MKMTKGGYRVSSVRGGKKDDESLVVVEKKEMDCLSRLVHSDVRSPGAGPRRPRMRMRPRPRRSDSAAELSRDHIVAFGLRAHI